MFWIFAMFLFDYRHLFGFHRRFLFPERKSEENIDEIQKVDDNLKETSTKSKNQKPPARKGAAGTQEPQDILDYVLIVSLLNRCFINVMLFKYA